MNGRLDKDFILSDEHISIKVIDYSVEQFISFEQSEDYDLFFYIKPPHEIYQSSKAICHSGFNFKVSETEIYKQLENALKEKKKQHKHSSLKDKIIFLDSENLPEFQMSLFHTDDMFKYEHVKKVYDKIGMKEIICFTRRSFDEFGPLLITNAFYPQHMENEAIFIKKLFSNYIKESNRVKKG